MVYLNANQIYQKLLDENILEVSGKITFNLLDVDVEITTRDVIGNILQNWLEEYFKKNNIEFDVPGNSQEFPDFYLKKENGKSDLLEIKTFDTDRGPNFDIANFESYLSSLKEKPYRLNADYLILGYTMDQQGNISISNIWLKKIWEISAPSNAYPVKIQQKRGMIYNLRPCIWFSKNGQFRPFQNKIEFIEALYQTLKKYPKTSTSADSWLKELKTNSDFEINF